MPKRKRDPVVVQNAPFFRLPAELRNQIYGLVAIHEPQISVHSRTNQILFMPSLSLVCHQIRTEYEPFFLDLAPKHAARMMLHSATLGRYGAVCAGINRLTPHSNQIFTHRAVLTHSWNMSHLKAIARLDYESFPLIFNGPTGLYFDPRTQDLEQCRQAIKDLDTVDGGKRIKDAFVDAFARHGIPVVPVAPASKKRKGKRI